MYLAMKAKFTHIFIQAGIKFNFSYKLHLFLSDEISALLTPSLKFLKLYNVEDYTLIFNISAKKELAINEIVGPLTNRKNKEIEFTIFLPYSVIIKTENPKKTALRQLFLGIYKVLSKYDIDIHKIVAKENEIITYILESPEMFD